MLIHQNSIDVLNNLLAKKLAKANIPASFTDIVGRLETVTQDLAAAQSAVTTASNTQANLSKGDGKATGSENSVAKLEQLVTRADELATAQRDGPPTSARPGSWRRWRRRSSGRCE